jgi:hypothetical protein
MRTFQIVEDKVKETDFFLDKIEETTFGLEVFFGARYYLSAFLSASRSITFALQASLKGLDGFDEWYVENQNKLKQSDLAKYFLEARNYSQKVGYYPLSGGRSYHDENNKLRIDYFFDPFPDDIKTSVPQEDVVTACKKYFISLLELISDCFKRFGHIIDPAQYFVYSITEAGKSLDDIEEELGFPRSWTKIENISDKERIQMLRQQFEKDVTIDYVFEKYLAKTFFGVL